MGINDLNDSEIELREELHRVERKYFEREETWRAAERKLADAEKAHAELLAKHTQVVAGLRRLVVEDRSILADLIRSIVSDALELDKSNDAYWHWWERKDDDLTWDPSDPYEQDEW
jgi:chromosome segregation ATPase